MMITLHCGIAICTVQWSRNQFASQQFLTREVKVKAIDFSFSPKEHIVQLGKLLNGLKRRETGLSELTGRDSLNQQTHTRRNEERKKGLQSWQHPSWLDQATCENVISTVAPFPYMLYGHGIMVNVKWHCEIDAKFLYMNELRKSDYLVGNGALHSGAKVW